MKSGKGDPTGGKALGPESREKEKDTEEIMTTFFDEMGF